MPWFKVDDGFHGHPKVVELSLAAVGIWSLAGSWCAKYLTDGLIGLRAIERMGGNEALAHELVAHGLWLQVAEGFVFKDWAEYQPLKVAVEAERTAARDRMASVRAQKKGVQPNTSRTQAERSPEVRIAPSQSQSLPVGGVFADAEMPPSRYCSRHPNGSDESCRACGDARRAFDSAFLAIKNRPTPRPPTSSELASRMCPEPEHENYPLAGGCEACRRRVGLSAGAAF